ncbi:MAG TPA: alpha/beta fold hydrolase [Patescibacteria group bacterium]|nr:alpha/beta fold hydrolase [Patescibacteria group bacterium]
MKITANGISISYSQSGDPTGTPVVFLHGFPFSRRMWDSQLALFKNLDGFQAIAPDIRGHGGSSVAGGQYSIEMFVDDLFALFDTLDFKKVILCGLSMGGYIALRAVERDQSRFKTLILCNTKSEADTNAAKIKRSEHIKAIRQKGVEVFARGFVQGIFAEDTLRNNKSVVTEIRKIIEKNSPSAICGTLLALAARTDTTDFLKEITIPTLILVGEEDTLTTPENAHVMHHAIKNSELHVLKNAAHMSNLENPDEFNKTILRFLKSNV